MCVPCTSITTQLQLHKTGGCIDGQHPGHTCTWCHGACTCRVSGASPTHPDSYDIDLEVPAPTMDQATAPLLQNLNNSREIEQVKPAAASPSCLSVSLCHDAPVRWQRLLLASLMHCLSCINFACYDCLQRAKVAKPCKPILLTISLRCAVQFLRTAMLHYLPRIMCMTPCRICAASSAPFAAVEAPEIGLHAIM